MLALPRFPKASDRRPETDDSPLNARLRILIGLLSRHSPTMLRMSLGLVYVWFGALKMMDATPVADLVAATVPFVPENLLLPVLGGFEVVLGIALLVGRYLGLIVFLMVGHLAGTFLVLVTQPDVAFLHNNPLQLSMTGEFVMKNLVLITAGLVLVTATRAASGPAQTTAQATAQAPAPQLVPASQSAD